MVGISNNDANKEISKDLLVEAWKFRHSEADYYLDLLWKNAEYFLVVISALISAKLVGLGLIYSLEDYSLKLALEVILIFFSVLIIFLCTLGRDIAYHRFSRYMEVVAHIAKIEVLLGLSEPLSEVFRNKGVFENDTYLFDRFVKSRKGEDGHKKFKSEKEWIEGKLERKNTPYAYLRAVYFLFIVIAAVLFIPDILLLFILI